MSTECTIRSAQRADMPAITRLLNELNQHEGYDAQADTQALSAALFGDKRDVMLTALVACMDVEIVGAILFYPGYDTLSASAGYHLADMVVTLAYQRTGVGRALVRALAARALGENKAWVSLTALKDNHAAQDFYPALGMTRVDVDFFAIGKTALAQL